MDKEYDFLLVGAGLHNAVFAHLANKKGYKCLCIEKSDHIGGMCYTEDIDNIIVHKYGPHIFHTNEKTIWKFVNSIMEFTPYINSPLVNTDRGLFNLPVNMNTFARLFNVKTPKEALDIYTLQENKELIFNLIFKEYSKKQWNDFCTKELLDKVITRIPVRFTYNNNYFNDNYQGIPKEGYTKFIEKLFGDTPIIYNTRYTRDSEYNKQAKVIIYTGSIDELYNYKLGELDYITHKFEHKTLKDISNYQGVAVINDATDTNKYIRTIEHKHFDKYCTNNKSTIISYEYSLPSTKDTTPYYPIENDKNIELYKKYYSECYLHDDSIICAGRLGSYMYMDMDDIIKEAHNTFNRSKIYIKSTL